MSDLPKQLRIKAGMISMGERITWGSDSAIMEKAADLIEQQQQRIAELEAQAPKWISVDDELPQTYESYDFAGNDIEVSDIVATNAGYAVYKDGNWTSVDWDSSDLGKRVEGVTHWMQQPLKEVA